MLDFLFNFLSFSEFIVRRHMSINAWLNNWASFKSISRLELLKFLLMNVFSRLNMFVISSLLLHFYKLSLFLFWFYCFLLFKCLVYCWSWNSSSFNIILFIYRNQARLRTWFFWHDPVIVLLCSTSICKSVSKRNYPLFYFGKVGSSSLWPVKNDWSGLVVVLSWH